MSKPEYTCPQCGEHRFELTVRQSVDVSFYEDEDHEVDDGPRGDIEWGDSTEAICGDYCGWSGTLGEAKTPNEIDEAFVERMTRAFPHLGESND
jgi:hypothetical protein